MTHDILERIRLIRARHHAELMRADPSLIERAANYIEDAIVAGPFSMGQQMWRSLLRCDLEVVIAKMLSDDPDGQLLRSDSPFHVLISFTDVVERGNVWRQAKAELHAVQFKRKMAEAAGGLLEVDDVRVLLGHKTKQAVHKAVQDHRLLAVDDDGREKFPACQFDDGTVYPGIQAILKAARDSNGWRILQYLFGRDEGLAGARPIDLIKGSSEDIERASRFARRIES